jgi:carbamate kinase
MRIMVALGRNALLERGEKPDVATQRRHIRRAAEALAPLAAQHELIVCHGNDPPVGLLALESETDTFLSQAYPLDGMGAQTQGMIGYWLVQELHNAGVTRPVIALITQTVVDATDPAFAKPRKFIGASYGREAAARLAGVHGWTVAADGPVWRRVVPSPQPQRVIERESIRQLLGGGAVVVCGGGGGAPVLQDSAGRLTGVEAVVDKDFTAAQIAVAVSAERLLLLTDVAAVMRDFGTSHERPIRSLNLAEVARLVLPASSMGPKIAACARFTSVTGHPSAIGALADAGRVLVGNAGTTIETGLSRRRGLKPNRVIGSRDASCGPDRKRDVSWSGAHLAGSL